MQSTNDPRLLIGLGSVSVVESVTIRWPSGAVCALQHLSPRKTYEVIEPLATDGKAKTAVLDRLIPESR